MLRHALGLPIDPRRETVAAGVMMLPIARAGRLVAVHGQDEARAVPHVTALEISIPLGGQVRPLPEGDRYLGFLFASVMVVGGLWDLALSQPPEEGANEPPVVATAAP